MINNIFNTTMIHERTYGNTDEDIDKKQGHEVNNQIQNNCHKTFQESDKIINVFSDKPNLELLTMISNHQKQIILNMLGQYPEREIALMLQASIDNYANKINYIYGWTQGGKEMFSSSLELMFNNIIEQGIEGVDYEDMFQLAMLDALLHAEEYGIDDATLTKMGTLLEKSGTGGHTNWNSSPESLGEIAKFIWSKLANSNMPSNSLAYKAMSAIAGGNFSTSIPDKLKNQFKSEVYNDPDKGGWLKDNGEGNNLDPFVKMVVMSHLLEIYTLTQEQIEKLLKSNSLNEINEIVSKVSDGEYTDTIKFLFSVSDNWHGKTNPGAELPSGVSIVLDYDGTPDATYLKFLYKNLPGRELGEDEIEEINRIGDQVKMLQQTLKYWVQICTDGQLSIARNI